MEAAGKLVINFGKHRESKQGVLDFQACHMRSRKLTEDCSGRIITGKTGLAHTRTVQELAHVHLISRCSSRAVVDGSLQLREGVGGGRCGQPLLGRDDRCSNSGATLTHCR